MQSWLALSVVIPCLSAFVTTSAPVPFCRAYSELQAGVSCSGVATMSDHSKNLVPNSRYYSAIGK